MSVRCVLSWANCACSWAYCRFLAVEEDGPEDEEGLCECIVEGRIEGRVYGGIFTCMYGICICWTRARKLAGLVVVV